MTKNKIDEMREFGVEFWNDSCDLEHLAEAVNFGAVGATSNPVIVFQAFARQKEFYLPVLKEILLQNRSATEDEITWALIKDLGLKASQILLPCFEKTNAKQGKLSLQVDPRFYTSATKMIKHAKELADLAPNIVIKVPATAPGIEAIEELTACGISTNATVSFSIAQAIACAEAVERGLEQLRIKGLSSEALTPYITIMIGRVEDYIRRSAEQEGILISPGALAWSGPAVFKDAYKLFKTRAYKAKLLAAAYRHQIHWTSLIGDGLVQSIPYSWWKLFANSTLSLSHSIDLAIPNECRHELETSPEFQKLIKPDGIKPDDFIKLGASQHTLNQFLQGLDSLMQWVRSEMLKGA